MLMVGRCVKIRTIVDEYVFLVMGRRWKEGSCGNANIGSQARCKKMRQ